MTDLEALAAAYEATLHDRAARGYANGVRSTVLDLKASPRMVADRVQRVEDRAAIYGVPADDYDVAFAQGVRDVLTEVGR